MKIYTMLSRNGIEFEKIGDELIGCLRTLENTRLGDVYGFEEADELLKDLHLGDFENWYLILTYKNGRMTIKDSSVQLKEAGVLDEKITGISYDVEKRLIFLSYIDKYTEDKSALVLETPFVSEEQDIERKVKQRVASFSSRKRPS